jgi:hypothetical protein
MMTHKEMTKHLRNRLKVAGIKARVAMCDSCGQPIIKVHPVSAEARFSDDEQRTIRHIAECNKLTRARGMEIDVERMTDPFGMRFEFRA